MFKVIVNGLPCDICRGAVAHVPGCDYGSVSYKTKPSQSGDYGWRRYPEDEWQIVSVYLSAGGYLACCFGPWLKEGIAVEHMPGEWSVVTTEFEPLTEDQG